VQYQCWPAVAGCDKAWDKFKDQAGLLPLLLLLVLYAPLMALLLLVPTGFWCGGAPCGLVYSF
jgi:hypothetical protein